MPDQRLLELASRAGDAARPPDFRDLARRGDRLRRVRTAGAGLAVAALLATTVFGVQAVYDDQAGPVPPAQPTVEPLPSPPLTDNSATPLEDLTPKQIVYDEDARLETAIPVPSAGTGATAAIWSVCRKSDCARALALTTDGFETGTHVDLSQFSGAPILGDAGGGSILLADRAMAMDAPVIVSPDGSTRPLRRSTEPGPMLADEVLVDGGKWISYRQSFFKTMNPVAVNVQTATSHPISIPGQGTFVQLVQSGRSTLWGPSIAIEGGPLPQGEAIWSEDGGATWDSHPLPSDLVSDGGVVNLAGADAMAFALPAESAPTHVFGSLDGGQTWQAFELPAEAWSGSVYGVVTSDSSLLISVTGSREEGGPPPRVGLYQTDGTDWSTLNQIDAPFAVLTDVDRVGFGLVSSAPYTFDGKPAIYGDKGGRMWVSTDDGATWTEQPTR